MSVDYDFSVHQVDSKFIECPQNYQQLIFHGRIFYLCIIKDLTRIIYGVKYLVISLSKYCSNRKITSIIFELK